MAPTLLLVGAVGGSAVVTLLATWWPLRSLAAVRDAHWTVRARHVWAVRIGVTLPQVVMPVAFAAAGALFSGPLTALSTAERAAVGAAGAVVGATLAGGRARRRQDALSPIPSDAVPVGERWLGTASFILVGYGHLLLLLLAALMAPATWSASFWAAAGFAAVALVAWGSGFGLLLARLLGLARPASGRLAVVVADASRDVGVVPTGTWQLRWHRANAFAFVSTGQLAFTEGALRLLSDQELAAIAAHELGHVSEPRQVRWLRRLQPLALLPVVFLRPVYTSIAEFDGEVPLAFLALLAVAVTVLLLLRLIARLARRMEERADAVAHGHEEDVGGYARALERIYEVNGVPAVLGRKAATHPDLYDRMVASGVEPDWPKPEAAPVAMPRRVVLGGLVGTLSCYAMLWIVMQMVVSSAAMVAATTLRPGVERSMVALSSRMGGDAATIAALARLKWNTEGPEAAIPWMKAAIELNPWDAGLLADQAIVLAFAGRCEEAHETMLTLDEFEGWDWYADRAHDSVGAVCDRD